LCSSKSQGDEARLAEEKKKDPVSLKKP